MENSPLGFPGYDPTNVPSKLCACVRAHRSLDERTKENLECT